MSTDNTHPFKAGEWVMCVSPGSYYLTIGKPYQVIQTAIRGADPWVWFMDDRGDYEECYASRFEGPASPLPGEVHKVEAATEDHSASGMLTEAATIVAGARNNTNQHPDDGKERSFVAIAALWEAYLGARRDGHEAPVSARDVAWMMVLLKIARSTHSAPVRDHFVDAAGYAAIAGEIAMATTK